MSDARDRELVPLTEREAAEIQGGESLLPVIIICFPPPPFPYPRLPFPIPTGPWLEA